MLDLIVMKTCAYGSGSFLASPPLGPRGLPSVQVIDRGFLGPWCILRTDKKDGRFLHKYIYGVGQIGFVVVLPIPQSLAMRTHPPRSQQSNGSYQRSDRLSPPAALRIPGRVLQLGGGDIPSHAVRTDDESEVVRPLDIELSLVSGRDKLVNLACQLQFFLSANYPWFGQEDLEVIGTQPIDVGCFSEVWMGKTGGRVVAVKSFRSWTSADGALVYEVINLI